MQLNTIICLVVVAVAAVNCQQWEDEEDVHIREPRAIDQRFNHLGHGGNRGGIGPNAPRPNWNGGFRHRFKRQALEEGPTQDQGNQEWEDEGDVHIREPRAIDQRFNHIGHSGNRGGIGPNAPRPNLNGGFRHRFKRQALEADQTEVQGNTQWEEDEDVHIRETRAIDQRFNHIGHSGNRGGIGPNAPRPNWNGGFRHRFKRQALEADQTQYQGVQAWEEEEDVHIREPRAIDQRFNHIGHSGNRGGIGPNAPRPNLNGGFRHRFKRQALEADQTQVQGNTQWEEDEDVHVRQTRAIDQRFNHMGHSGNRGGIGPNAPRPNWNGGFRHRFKRQALEAGQGNHEWEEDEDVHERETLAIDQRFNHMGHSGNRGGIGPNAPRPNLNGGFRHRFKRQNSVSLGAGHTQGQGNHVNLEAQRRLWSANNGRSHLDTYANYQQNFGGPRSRDYGAGLRFTHNF